MLLCKFLYMTPGELFFPSFQHALWGCPNLVALKAQYTQPCVHTVMEAGRVPGASERQERILKSPKTITYSAEHLNKWRSSFPSPHYPSLIQNISQNWKSSFLGPFWISSGLPPGSASFWTRRQCGKMSGGRAWTQDTTSMHFGLSLLLSVD